MLPESEDRAFKAGCVFVGFGLVGFGLCAYIFDPKLWIGFGLLAATWLGIGQTRLRRQKKRDSKVFNDTFEMFDRSKPGIEESYLYGFIHFTITFQTESDMKRAEELGFVERYREAIQDLYGHTGSETNPFDAEIAVYATYEGRVYETVSTDAG